MKASWNSWALKEMLFFRHRCRDKLTNTPPRYSCWLCKKPRRRKDKWKIFWIICTPNGTKQSRKSTSRLLNLWAKMNLKNSKLGSMCLSVNWTTKTKWLKQFNRKSKSLWMLRPSQKTMGSKLRNITKRLKIWINNTKKQWKTRFSFIQN